MKVYMDTCTYCSGAKVAQRLEEKRGDDWHPNTDPYLRANPELVDEIVGSFPGILRWADTDCPRCDGRGEYIVETFTCKIF